MKILLLILIPIFSFAQAKNDSILTIPPTLESKMINAQHAIEKAKEDAAKAQKEIDDAIKILFEIVGRKPEEYEVAGYSPGILKIKRKKK